MDDTYVYGGISSRAIERLINELEERKSISLDDSFNLGIHFTIQKLARLLYEDEYVDKIYSKLK